MNIVDAFGFIQWREFGVVIWDNEASCEHTQHVEYGSDRRVGFERQGNKGRIQVAYIRNQILLTAVGMLCEGALVREVSTVSLDGPWQDFRPGNGTVTIIAQKKYILNEPRHLR